MGRILLLILIAFAIYLLFRGFMRSQARKPTDAVKPGEAEDMVACVRCGVNLPRSAAREEAGRWVCLDNPHCR
ncbi:MAG TPA: PP0621 family protein [Usitatibacter sp.]|nr:PP0621 family protein [Usitatibacter sp.]